MKILSLINNQNTFVNQFNECFISIRLKDHTEIWPIDSHKLKDWLLYEYFQSFDEIASKSALNDALGVIQGKAKFQSPSIITHNRCAKSGDNYYVDLAVQNSQAIEISLEEWKIVKKSNVCFIKSSGIRPLPIPKRNGKLEDIKKFINVPDNDDFLLVIAFLLESLRPETSYPILLIDGEQGCAKSTTQKYIKSIIDPSSMSLRVAPKSIQDIFVAAKNDHIISYNNLSDLTREEQDAFCCISTGGTYSKRKLFSDMDECSTEIKKPVILNGIGAIASAPDFYERCILLNLPRINSKSRKSELQLDKEFREAHPMLLGAIIDLFTKAISIVPQIKLTDSPRMMDFAILGTAMCTALGYNHNKFVDIYFKNQIKGNLFSIDSNPAATGIIKMLDTIPAKSISCTFSQLLEKLKPYYTESSFYPKSPKALASSIKRIAPALRRIDIKVDLDPIRRSDGYHVLIIDNRSQH